MGLIMRQVPAYLIVGDGRVARHLACYFSHLGIDNVARWHRSQGEAELLRKAESATHILLAVNDGAIEPLAQKLTDFSALKIHFSGALATDAAYGAHPLMTFGAKTYALEKYKSIAFVIDDDAPAFTRVLPLLPNEHYRLKKSDKAKYHALCVMAGNFSCLLWQKLFGALEGEWNIPAAAAQAYVRQQTENLVEDYARALTGPLARGDKETVARNMSALEGDAFFEIYKSFVQAYPRITREQNIIKEKAS